MKGRLLYVETKYADKLTRVLNDVFIEYTFLHLPSKTKPGYYKVIVDTGEMKLPRIVVDNIKYFCEGFTTGAEEFS